ncbi:HET-domain-containing protein [Corynespora cassiicola Philippines]|uniref:HET-domain-containing protein n=1 Tax=Corynespora cassiicola Philippines TaxID=1448308 RepID=A0A2T2NLW5_CORCC|nr:HET-domain-containing protein [Corynespora cassiicola Philippines]
MPQSYTPLTICYVCVSIFSPGSYDAFKDKNKSVDFSGRSSEFREFHHSSKSSLFDAADAGCRLCRGFVDKFREELLNDKLEFPLGFGLERVHPDRRQEQGIVTEYWLYICTFGQRRNEGMKYAIRSWKDPNSIVDYEYCNEPGMEDMKLRNLALESQASTYTGSDSVLEFARAMLERCQKTHKDCNQSIEKGWVPTRLLDVSYFPRIRLAEKSKEQVEGAYTTLSHCWGTRPFWNLTSDTLEELRKGVDVSRFEKTFRHALQVIRFFGIQYIWIDCFCILQGSDEKAIRDWDIESSRMHKIYANSVLNIGASFAENPMDGLFCSREALMLGRIQWKPMGDDPVSEEWTIHHPRSWQGRFIHPSEHLLDSKLLQRGWVMQEVILSCRMLSFHSDQIHWQCSEAVHCEESVECAKYVLKHVSSTAPFWTIKELPLSYQKLSDRIYNRWLSLLVFYSKTVFTYRSKDILRALDGIMAWIATRTHDIHHRGILGKTFFKVLLWSPLKKFTKMTDLNWSLYIPGGPEGTHLDSFSPGLPHEIRDSSLPSWHWASCTRQLLFPVTDEKFFPMAYAFLSIDGSALPSSEVCSTWPFLYLVGRKIPVPSRTTLFPEDTVQINGLSFDFRLDYKVFTLDDDYETCLVPLLYWARYIVKRFPENVDGLMICRKRNDVTWTRVAKFWCSAKDKRNYVGFNPFLAYKPTLFVLK